MNEYVGYAKLPYALKEGHTATEWLLAGYIAGMTRTSPAKLSLSSISKKIGRALSTVWAARQTLEGEDLIEHKQCEEVGQKRFSTYEYKGCAVERGYFRFDWFLLSDEEKYEFIDKKTKTLLAYRPLTTSEALIIALVASYKDGYKGSANTIARTLGLSLRTVNAALKALVEQSAWLFRPDRGKNAYVTSRYVVNGERMRALRKKYRSKKEIDGIDYAAAKERKEREEVRKINKALDAQEAVLKKEDRIEAAYKSSPEYCAAKKEFDAAHKAWFESCRKEGIGSPKEKALSAERDRKESCLERIKKRIRRELEG